MYRYYRDLKKNFKFKEYKNPDPDTVVKSHRET